MKKVKKEIREKIEKRLKKIKYRLYQSEIRFVSHDHEALIDSIRKIRLGCSDILKQLSGKPKRKVVKPVITARRKSASK